MVLVVSLCVRRRASASRRSSAPPTTTIELSLGWRGFRTPVVSKNTNELKTLANRGVSDRHVSALIGEASLQGDVCVLCWPPAFAAVPQYLIHTSVELLPLSELDKRLSRAYGSSVSLQQASALRHGFRSTRMRDLGHPTLHSLGGNDNSNSTAEPELSPKKRHLGKVRWPPKECLQ